MTDERTRQAARNNAFWCDAVCRAHGRPGVFTSDIWVNDRATPAYYPNAVTLTDTGCAAQVEQIVALCDAGVRGEWGVKDSFCTLDLSRHGFRILLEAQWIYRPMSSPQRERSGESASWSRVRSTDALAEWEKAWRGDTGDAAPVFLPSLLGDDAIAVLGAYHGLQLIGGAVANRTGDVVGLSNIFVRGIGADRLWAGCVAAAIATFPGLPIVGYESGGQLTLAHVLGFESAGPLRVWVKTDPE
jgi:hypothetical protein